MRSLKTNRVVAGTVLAVIAVAVVMVRTSGDSALAQQAGQATTPAQPAAAISGISRQPSEAARKVLLDSNDTAVLLLDHQTGLFQTVKDIPVQDLRTNTVVLAKIAEHAKAPIIMTASEPNGPNGPLMPELAHAAPSAKYVAREVSAWDNDDFVKAVEATGRKTLIIAGVWTSVCVAFPALQAKADGAVASPGLMCTPAPGAQGLAQDRKPGHRHQEVAATHIGYTASPRLRGVM